jgi:hypothetical protein
MTARFPTGESIMAAPPYQALEARLDAQRRVLRWILARMVTSPAQFADLVENLDQSVIPQDHQEDPGAVPTEEFGQIAAFAAEMRAILDPVKRQHRDEPS